MSATAAKETLAAGRALSVSLMVDTCVVRRPTGRTAIDPTTRRETVVWETLFTSKCKIQSSAVQAWSFSDSQAAGRTAITLDSEIQMPWDTPRLDVGDEIEITASTVNPQSVGRKYRVDTPTVKTFSTKSGVQVQEVIA